MDTARTMVRMPRAALRVPRLLAALALAIALVATAAARPEDAGALRMSERTMSRICYASGGSIEYDFWGPVETGLWWMTCTLPGGDSFTCLNSAVVAGTMECGPL
jgi:hypothetical protein